MEQENEMGKKFDVLKGDLELVIDHKIKGKFIDIDAIYKAF